MDKSCRYTCYKLCENVPDLPGTYTVHLGGHHNDYQMANVS